MTAAKLLGEFEERTLEVRGIPLRVLLGGPEDGPPVVLVHGLGGSSTNWALVAPGLARRRRVLLLDLPGHAWSEPFPGTPSLGDYADCIADAAGALGLLPADFVGHSLGGLVSLRLAVRRPAAVRRIVLAAAAGITSSTRHAERALALMGWVQPGRRISPHWRRVAGSPTLRRIVFARWFAADPAALPPEAVEALLRDVNLNTDTASAWRALARDDPRTDLDRVERECLVLWGAEDRQLPLADAVDYARRLRAPLRTIAGCGHLLIAERPGACLDAIEAFLDTP